MDGSVLAQCLHSMPERLGSSSTLQKLINQSINQSNQPIYTFLFSAFCNEFHNKWLTCMDLMEKITKEKKLPTNMAPAKDIFHPDF